MRGQETEEREGGDDRERMESSKGREEKAREERKREVMERDISPGPTPLHTSVRM